MNHLPVCDYEGSDYQTSFWEKGGRKYEDLTEEIALKRLLPSNGRLMLEVGAGAGRNTPRYAGFDQIVLLDYSRTQLEQARQRLGDTQRYIYVAADAYRLPFVDGLFGAATMIRTLHHMVDAPGALRQVCNVLEPGGIFILEFANKLNLKSILRFLLRRQDWSPFSPEPVEFVKLNFDFHPRTMRTWLQALGFKVEKTLAVSHFRVGFLKRFVPTQVLVWFDSLLQWTGALWQLTPSIFMRCRAPENRASRTGPGGFFKCPHCGNPAMEVKADYLHCPGCENRWEIRDGIYDFREPIHYM